MKDSSEIHNLTNDKLAFSGTVLTRYHGVHVFGYVIRFLDFGRSVFLSVSRCFEFGSKDHVRDLAWLVTNYSTAVVNNVAQGNITCDHLYLNNFTKYTTPLMLP